VLWGLFGGLSIGLPPVIHFGSKFLKDKTVKDCLEGKKFICLAITEPYAGSDVASIRTTAVKDPSGKARLFSQPRGSSALAERPVPVLRGERREEMDHQRCD